MLTRTWRGSRHLVNKLTICLLLPQYQPYFTAKLNPWYPESMIWISVNAVPDLTMRAHCIIEDRVL